MRARLLLCSGATIALLLASCGDDADDTDAAAETTARRVVSADVAAAELVTGDCVSGLVIGAAERRTIDSARVVDCGSAHELEVFATFELTAADFDDDTDLAGGAYPGEERVVMAADQGCAARLDELGIDDGLGVIAIWPTGQSWMQADRGVSCAAYSTNGQPFEGRTLIGGATG